MTPTRLLVISDQTVIDAKQARSIVEIARVADPQCIVVTNFSLSRRVRVGDEHNVASEAELRASLSVADSVLVLASGSYFLHESWVHRLLTAYAESSAVIYEVGGVAVNPVKNSHLVVSVHPVDELRAHGKRRLLTVLEYLDRLSRESEATSVALFDQERGAYYLENGRSAVFIPVDPLPRTEASAAIRRFVVILAVVSASDVPMRTAHELAATTAGGDFPNSSGSSCKAIARETRDRGGLVIATGGCFDILHAGHVSTLQASRRLGDCLLVFINSDNSVRRLKGAGRPIVSAEDRMRVLVSLVCVDAVATFDEEEPARLIKEIRPDIWVKGGDYAGRMLPEQSVMEAWGGRTIVLPFLPGRSTSAIVERAQDSAPL